MAGIVLDTGPSVEPVTLAEVKSYIRKKGSDEDALITIYAKAARRSVEAHLGKVLLDQTWIQYLDRFPSKAQILLDKTPLRSVTHVKYTPDGGSATTFSASSYVVDAAAKPGRVVLKDDESWPTDALEVANGLAVTFVAGYGAAATDVPDDVIMAVLLFAAHCYENREPVVLGIVATPIPLTITSMLMGERRMVLA